MAHASSCPTENRCEGTGCGLRESERWAGKVKDQNLRDAGLIASAQRLKHYQIAVYGTLATWAKQLHLDDEADLLAGILKEHKRADEQLTTLAKQLVNLEAAEA